MRRVLLAVAFVCLAASAAIAQDPVKVDAKHYKLVSENAQVRILRFSYGPHEKSVMHAHPDLVVVYLTDMKVKMTLPDGKSVEQSGKAGEAQFTPAGIHLPENDSDKTIEGILVELKGHPAAKHAAKPAAKAEAKPTK
jgi:quercetin dioxygenase-like cupin family protein